MFNWKTQLRFVWLLCIIHFRDWIWTQVEVEFPNNLPQQKFISNDFYLPYCKHFFQHLMYSIRTEFCFDTSGLFNFFLYICSTKTDKNWKKLRGVKDEAKLRSKCNGDTYALGFMINIKAISCWSLNLLAIGGSFKVFDFSYYFFADDQGE